HTRSKRDWSSDVCSSDLNVARWRVRVLRPYRKCTANLVRQRVLLEHRPPSGIARTHYLVELASLFLMQNLHSERTIGWLVFLFEIGRASGRERLCWWVGR